MMAVGVRRRQIVSMFLIEGAVLGFVGALAGALLGLIVVAVLNHHGVFIPRSGQQGGHGDPPVRRGPLPRAHPGARERRVGARFDLPVVPGEQAAPGGGAAEVMSRLLSLAVRNVARNRRRSLITLGAILLGVTAAVVLRGVSEGLLKLVVDDVVNGRTGALQVHRAGYLDSVEGNPLDSRPPRVARARREAPRRARGEGGHPAAAVHGAGLERAGADDLRRARDRGRDREAGLPAVRVRRAARGQAALAAATRRSALVGYELAESFGLKPPDALATPLLDLAARPGELARRHGGGAHPVGHPVREQAGGDGAAAARPGAARDAGEGDRVRGRGRRPLAGGRDRGAGARGARARLRGRHLERAAALRARHHRPPAVHLRAGLDDPLRDRPHRDRQHDADERVRAGARDRHDAGGRGAAPAGPDPVPARGRGRSA